MELQHVNIKLMLANPEQIDLEPLVPIFHSWIQEQAPGDLLLDIADYRHVPAGPGVVLIGHQGDYSVDNARDRLGVRYNRKAELEGDNASRLRQAGVAALEACRRLESDARLAGKFHFNGREVELFINDRLLAPNTDATRHAAEADLRGFFSQLFGGASFAMSYGDEPRRLFSVSAKTEQPFTVVQLLANLAS